MKFLCIPCDEKMETQTDGIMPEEKKNLAMKFRCKKCGHSIAMLTNNLRLSLLANLGFKWEEQQQKQRLPPWELWRER